MHIYDLLDQDELREAIDNKWVKEQFHPTEPLAILNYTDLAAFSGTEAWNETTLQCRGLIYNTTDGEVVARPFRKFFNYGQPGAALIGLDSEVEVTDKIDGSLAICYREPTSGLLSIATRGSFTSDQAVAATRVLREKYSQFVPLPEDTILFEFVAPWNRIVLDYGDLEDLVLLGSVEIETGYINNPRVTRNFHGWPGPMAQHFAYLTLADALSAEPRPNAEGYVIRQKETDLIVKCKQADYIALHRTLTHTSARTLWEFLAVNACQDLIHQAKHWGSYLGIDPARVLEIQAVEGDWLAAVLDGVPDEFYEWVRQVIDRIEHEVENRIAEGLRSVVRVRRTVGDDALAAYRLFEADPLDKELMRVYRGGSADGLMLKAWRLATPGVELPFARSEDAA